MHIIKCVGTYGSGGGRENIHNMEKPKHVP